MILLKESDYKKVIEPLIKVTINKLFAMVVVERKVSGKIYVDNIENPTTFYIIHPYGMSLLFGGTENTNFNEKFLEYSVNKNNARDKTEWLQVFPDSWYSKIESMLGRNLIKKNSLKNLAVNNDEPGNVIENTRVNFVFNQTKYEQYRKLLTHSDSYQIVKIDKKIYSEEGSVVPKHFWNDSDQFLKHGIGFSLVCNVNGVSVVASTAFSSYIVNDMLEIGIETNAQFKGKGLAAIVCSHLIDYCLEHGFIPIWSCRLENTASYKVAQKLGFEPEKYLPYYKLNSSPKKIKESQLESSKFSSNQETKLSSYSSGFMANIGKFTNNDPNQQVSILYKKAKL